MPVDRTGFCDVEYVGRCLCRHGSLSFLCVRPLYGLVSLVYWYVRAVYDLVTFVTDCVVEPLVLATPLSALGKEYAGRVASVPVYVRLFCEEALVYFYSVRKFFTELHNPLGVFFGVAEFTLG